MLKTFHVLYNATAGTVEFRSLLEPMRNSNPFVTYFEATCDNIDPVKKVWGYRPQKGVRVTTHMPVCKPGRAPGTYSLVRVRVICFAAIVPSTGRTLHERSGVS